MAPRAARCASLQPSTKSTKDGCRATPLKSAKSYRTTVTRPMSLAAQYAIYWQAFNPRTLMWPPMPHLSKYGLYLDALLLLVDVLSLSMCSLAVRSSRPRLLGPQPNKKLKLTVMGDFYVTMSTAISKMMRADVILLLTRCITTQTAKRSLISTTG